MQHPWQSNLICNFLIKLKFLLYFWYIKFLLLDHIHSNQIRMFSVKACAEIFLNFFILPHFKTLSNYAYWKWSSFFKLLLSLSKLINKFILTIAITMSITNWYYQHSRLYPYITLFLIIPKSINYIFIRHFNRMAYITKSYNFLLKLFPDIMSIVIYLL